MPDLKSIFANINASHTKPNEADHALYTLHDDARVEFVAFHDDLNERKRQQHRRDRDRRSVLSKAKGQVIRIAAVNYALDQAIMKAMNGNGAYEWSYVIPKEHMVKALVLINYLMEQKFALGKPSTKRPAATNANGPLDNGSIQFDHHKMKRLLELPSPITVAKISQNHIKKRVDNKYRKEEALELMVTAEQLEIGVVVVEHYNTGRIVRYKKELRKRKLMI
jgi:hypothetical protein